MMLFSNARLFSFCRPCVLFLGVLSVGLLCSCTSYRYMTPRTEATKNPYVADKNAKDSGPKQSLDVSHIQDAIPRREPRSKSGNKTPYTVLGKTYHVQSNVEGFTQKGKASWYGKKFHGKLTSNGELYDMYGMTAAHKTLPLPSFVRVKNQANGKVVVVRVNDRGPFHDDRIIDLTYSAAKKLGFQHLGTANVVVELIPPSEYAPEGVGLSEQSGRGQAKNSAPTPRHSGGYELPPNTFLQVGAYSSLNKAREIKRLVAGVSKRPILIEPVVGKPLYKVVLGPFDNGYEMALVQESLSEEGLGEPNILYR